MKRQNLIEELKRKNIELENEHEFYKDLRRIPNKNPSDWSAQKMSERSIDKLRSEISELETEIKKPKR